MADSLQGRSNGCPGLASSVPFSWRGPAALDAPPRAHLVAAKPTGIGKARERVGTGPAGIALQRRAGWRHARCLVSGFPHVNTMPTDMNDTTTVDLLNDLLETCNDAESCCRGAADHTETPELKRVLGETAAGCAQAAAELASLVRQRGGEPEEGGSIGGKLQRSWQAVTGSLGGGSDKALLEECEQVLGGAAADYRKALNEPSLPETVRTVVDRQLDGARRRHDQIRHLRDRFSGVQPDRTER